MDRLSAIEAKITDIDKRLQAATGRAKSPRALFSKETRKKDAFNAFIGKYIAIKSPTYSERRLEIWKLYKQIVKKDFMQKDQFFAALATAFPAMKVVPERRPPLGQQHYCYSIGLVNLGGE